MTLAAPSRLPVEEMTSVAQFEELARACVEPDAWRYFERGAGRERTLRDNLAAFRRWRFRPRVLQDVGDVSTAVEVLGEQLALPVLVAPLASQRLLHPAGECATARAAAAAQTVMCVSTGTNAAFDEIAAAAPDGSRWLQLYMLRDRGRTREIVAAAIAAGFSALVLTADTPYPAHGGGPAVPAGSMRPGAALPPGIAVPYMTPQAGEDPDGLRVSPSVTWRDVEWLAAETRLPVIVKGVLSADDAALACAHGAAGIVVSNHGGRQLDETMTPLDALNDVVQAVAERCVVLMDGGIRAGNDVLKALALGARAVLCGRPIAWGLAVGAEAGVARVLELLRREIALGLALLGCLTPAGVRREHIVDVGKA